MNNSKKIIVTGGAGYIGSHTVIELLSQGYRVTSMDNFSNSSPDVYDRITAITQQQPKTETVDLADKTACLEAFAKHSDAFAVIHFAAFKSVPESVASPIEYYRNNINSLLNVLEAATVAGIRNIIFSSSCSVYGNINQLPVNENTPLSKAASPYAYTKVIGERILEDYCQIHPEAKGISLRYFNPVGAHPSGLIGELPLDRPNNLVPVITQTAIGKRNQMEIFGFDYPTRDGTCIRDYIHVCDIAAAHVAAIEVQLEHVNYDVINLGSGQGVSVLEAISAFEKVSGKKVNYLRSPRRPGDVEAIYSDSSKAGKILNWTTRYNLEDMMKTAWQWEQNLNNK